MTPQAHEEIYRAALETATAELAQITTAVEELRVRKEHVEKLVSVLGPFIGVEPQASSTAAIESEPPSEPVAEHASEANLQRETVPADPFQRRIDHVLGIGAGIRDVRKYSRQF
jgi:hypothetical protein